MHRKRYPIENKGEVSYSILIKLEIKNKFHIKTIDT